MLNWCKYQLGMREQEVKQVRPRETPIVRVANNRLPRNRAPSLKQFRPRDSYIVSNCENQENTDLIVGDENSFKKVKTSDPSTHPALKNPVHHDDEHFSFDSNDYIHDTSHMYRINASYLCSDIIDVEMVAKQQSKTKPKYSFRNNENYPHHIITVPTSSEVSEITIKFDSNDVIEKITSKKNQQLSNNKKRTVLNHNSLDSPPNKKLDENDHTECLTNEFPTPKNCRDEIIAAGFGPQLQKNIAVTATDGVDIVTADRSTIDSLTPKQAVHINALMNQLESPTNHQSNNKELSASSSPTHHGGSSLLSPVFKEQVNDDAADDVRMVPVIPQEGLEDTLLLNNSSPPPTKKLIITNVNHDAKKLVVAGNNTNEEDIGISPSSQNTTSELANIGVDIVTTANTTISKQSAVSAFNDNSSDTNSPMNKLSTSSSTPHGGSLILKVNVEDVRMFPTTRTSSKLSQEEIVLNIDADRSSSQKDSCDNQQQ